MLDPIKTFSAINHKIDFKKFQTTKLSQACFLCTVVKRCFNKKG